VILGPESESGTPANHCGGTGKTQIAAAFALKLWAESELDLLVWLDAVSRDSIINGYAKALTDIRVAAPPGKPEAAAARFLTWLAETGRRWLVVLDGLVDAADVEGLWPGGPNGQVLITTSLTRLRPTPAALAGPRRGAAGATEHLAVAVTPFSRREAIDYMTARLNDDPYQAAGSLDLANALGCLPVGLALAVAYLLYSGHDCRRYWLICDQHRQPRPEWIAGDPLLPFWKLAVDQASQFAPRQLAWPALKLASVLGPARIPGAVLTGVAACAYVTGRPDVTRNEQASLRAAFGNLERLGLVKIDPDDEIRTVRMPAALQASVREAMSPAERRQAVRAAADAVFEAWPKIRAKAEVEQVLRDCAMCVQRSDPLALWNPGCHPLLVRLGQSLDDAHLVDTAFAYWRDLVARSAEYAGASAMLTFDLRERLAAAASAAGRSAEAASLREELVADVDQVAGPTHPQAIGSRAKLAAACRAAGRLKEAISLGERVVSDSEPVFGALHPRAIESLRELGSAYRDAELYPEAIGAFLRCLALREQVVGPMHSETTAARHDLADAYRRAGRADEAIRLYQETASRAENAFGAAHPDTVGAREDVAIACYRAGQADEAAAAFERILDDWTRVPGAGAADTVAARANLAAIYCLSARLKEAIPLYEGAVTDLERIRGRAQQETLRARWNLAAAYHKGKRLPEAIELGEATLADCERILGPGHWETLTARANLAHAYHAAGLLKRASAQFDRALRDGEQSLGPDDPLTASVRELRKRYLAGRQGAVPIMTPPAA
jgi:tetratricopeptide (TPR) repeat protein